jgi:ubiquitin-like 1-activating enzyme E1 A
MRSSTILLLTLRALSQEAIKNLVLAGVGRLIVMDDQVVSERDLGAGLLFREEDGDVGKMVSADHFRRFVPADRDLVVQRVLAALPQIKSLNPLVTVTPLSTLSPFVAAASGEQPAETIEEFLKREKVDLVCATDLAKEEMVSFGW